MSNSVAALPLISTMIGYLNAVKSPFYMVVAAGTFAACLVCKGVATAPQWWAVSTPLFVLLLSSILSSFSTPPTFDGSEHRDSLRFSRSMGISTALITFAVSVREADVFFPAFCICYVCCLIQAVIFLLYSYARSEIDESEAKTVRLNYVQFVLITATLLVGGCYCMVEFAKNYDMMSDVNLVEAKTTLAQMPDDASEWDISKAENTISNAQDVLTGVSRFAVTGGVLLVLWFGCICYWANYLRKVIHISFAMPGKT